MSGLETKRRRFQIGDPVINLSNRRTTTDDDERRTTTDDDDDDDGRRRRRRRRTTDDGRRTTDDDDDDDDGQMSKNVFKPCHHIDFNTTNPNPILRITISFTKTPKKPKYFRTL